ncbi:MAG: 6,7-dimethyl-8-ribityllumazine synthase [Methanomassiliicoccales archaeon]|nr:6,7-dimethyl-8-ribityllumazine synthase [Methanomassiliicoccales archaeon]
MKKYNLGIVVSEYNYDITSVMLERAKAQADFLEVNVAKVVTVPGVFDMPLAVKKLLLNKGIDGVVTLGAVIEGETEHDDIVITNAARKMTDLSVEFEKPVGLGVTGPGMTRLQAQDRVEKAGEVVESVVKLLKRLE